MLCELGKFPACSISEEPVGENGLVPSTTPYEDGASGGVAGGGAGEGRMKGSVGSDAVDRALVQHLIHCECLLQVR